MCSHKYACVCTIIHVFITVYSLGSGFVGFTFPGCPEEYYRFRQGDIVALPPGVPFWFYNDGNKPAELIIIFDINNDADQIESQHMVLVEIASNNTLINILNRTIYKQTTYLILYILASCICWYG